MDGNESPTGKRGWQRWLPTDYAVPGDAIAVISFVLVAALVPHSPLAESSLVRALIGFPLLFFVPGYALVSSLFPETTTRESNPLNWRDVGSADGTRALLDEGLDWRERVAISFGTSIALLPLIAVVLSVLGFGYGLDVLTASVAGFAVVGMGVAVVRRNRLPVHRRFRVPYRRWIDALDSGLHRQPASLDTALNVGLAVVVLVTVGAVGSTIVAPNHAQSFTTVSVLTIDENGERVAAGYPNEIDADGERLAFELENAEGKSVSYTVVAELQDVKTTGDSTRVVRREELLRTSTTLADGESWTREHTVQPALAGTDLRLTYYVYRGTVPTNPSTETAYRFAYVWVDVPADAID